MKKILAVYEISYCPLYSAIPNTETQHQQQEALWTTAKWFAINNHQTSIELCLISEPTSFTVRPFVLLYAPNTPTTDTQENELLNSFERILPDDYGWKRFYNIKNNQEFDDRQTFLKKVFENFDSYQWYSTSLKRRFEVFDISPKLLQSDTFWGTRPNTTISTDNTPTENETTPSTEFPLPTEPFYTNESQKQFPDTNPYAVKAQLLFSPISLPFHPAIQDTFCQRSFFQELLYSAPAIISTRLSPSRLDELFDRIHSLASFARRILEPYHWLINPDNTIPYSEVERFYSGFIGTQHNLSKFSIKVTTSDFSKTQSLALALITPLGGSRAFELSSPVCGFSTRIPIEEQAEQTRQYFQNLRINTSDEIFSQWEEGLVLLTPNIINQREADILLRLPIGDEQGLPGMEVRQPPPFATSTKNLSKENTNQTGYIQLGQIKTSKVNDKNNPNALYHSIKLKDLCKHALIVGSTGSGKTTTVQYLLKQIAQAKIPFLVIEPSMKAEYFEKLKDHIPHLKRVKVDDLCFDPMWIPKGKDKKDKDKDITAVQHISYLKSCFQAAFPINEYGIAHLETCLIKYYKYVQDKYLFLNQPENITYLARVNTGKKDEKNNHIKEFKIVNSKVENALPIPSFDNFTSCVQPILTESFPKGYREKDPNNWIDTLQR
ncbi:MAG: DUF87 domain-containing protein, partial [Planctomycetaceae bacterium]|nr:DUF87 domain-containing protein [Planctomycetaceae bacterium]